MEFKNNIVTVRYKNKHGAGYGESEYSYYADVPLKVGQIINVPTKYGTSKAKVAKIGISESTLPGVLKACMKRITEDCILLTSGGAPVMDDQLNIDLVSIAEDFFKMP